MHPDVVFHQGGRFPTAGTYVGRDAVFAHMMEFFALVEFSMKIAVHDIAATDEHAVSLVRVSLDSAVGRSERSLVVVEPLGDEREEAVGLGLDDLHGDRQAVPAHSKSH